MHAAGWNEGDPGQDPNADVPPLPPPDDDDVEPLSWEEDPGTVEVEPLSREEDPGGVEVEPPPPEVVPPDPLEELPQDGARHASV